MGDLKQVSNAAQEINNAMNLVLERGQKLNELSQKTAALENDAKNFANNALRLRMKVENGSIYELKAVLVGARDAITVLRNIKKTSKDNDEIKRAAEKVSIYTNFLDQYRNEWKNKDVGISGYLSGAKEAKQEVTTNNELIDNLLSEARLEVVEAVAQVTGIQKTAVLKEIAVATPTSVNSSTANTSSSSSSVDTSSSSSSSTKEEKKEGKTGWFGKKNDGPAVAVSVTVADNSAAQKLMDAENKAKSEIDQKIDSVLAEYSAKKKSGSRWGHFFQDRRDAQLDLLKCAKDPSMTSTEKKAIVCAVYRSLTKEGGLFGDHEEKLRVLKSRLQISMEQNFSKEGVSQLGVNGGLENEVKSEMNDKINKSANKASELSNLDTTLNGKISNYVKANGNDFPAAQVARRASDTLTVQAHLTDIVQQVETGRKAAKHPKV